MCHIAAEKIVYKEFGRNGSYAKSSTRNPAVMELCKIADKEFGRNGVMQNRRLGTQLCRRLALVGGPDALEVPFMSCVCSIICGRIPPTRLKQGCQIFLNTIYQNEGKYTKLLHHYQMAIKYSKCP
jgi:hypothetical protein